METLGLVFQSNEMAGRRSPIERTHRSGTILNAAWRRRKKKFNQKNVLTGCDEGCRSCQIALMSSLVARCGLKASSISLSLRRSRTNLLVSRACAFSQAFSSENGSSLWSWIFGGAYLVTSYLSNKTSSCAFLSALRAFKMMGTFASIWIVSNLSVIA